MLSRANRNRRFETSYAYSRRPRSDRKNKSIEAIRSEVGAVDVALVDQIPFKSQNRYSAVHIRAASGEYTLVLGACEALRGHLASDSENWEPAWKEMLPTGLRILMFAEGEAGRPFGETLDGMALRPLALVALSDELRPDAGAVLEALAAQGIAFKVISGDNPETVRATVGGLNLPLAREPVVSGDQLEQGDSAELIMNHSVFGRIAPEQKVLIVRSLQERGRHVAMIGPLGRLAQVHPAAAADHLLAHLDRAPVALHPQRLRQRRRLGRGHGHLQRQPDRPAHGPPDKIGADPARHVTHEVEYPGFPD